MAERGFKFKIGHGLGCSVSTGGLFGLQRVLLLPMAAREPERRPVDVSGWVCPKAHAAPVTESAGKCLLRHVLGSGPIQAADFERVRDADSAPRRR